MTYRKLLKEISARLKEVGIETADLDARVLVKYILKVDDATIFKNFDQAVNKKAVTKIQELAVRRANNEPIAYLIKQKEFFGLKFYVNESVLIPRPETESLVEESANFIQNRTTDNRQRTTVLDMGTGSGNIIISIVKSLDRLSALETFDFFATDISPLALKVAIHNAKQNGVFNKIQFLESDLFSNQDLLEKFDLIIANLPYVPQEVKSLESKVEREAISYEPQNAIFAEDNGTAIIKEFLNQASNRLNLNGLILIELDPRNALDIQKTAKKYFPNAKTELKKDLAGHDRYLIIA